MVILILGSDSISESIAMHKRTNNNDTEKCYGCNESAHFKRLSENRTISEKLIITTPKSWGSSNDTITSAINTRTILELESSITYTANKEPDETTNLSSSTKPLESYETKVTTLSPAWSKIREC
ncbi:uncharacterized protein LOC123301294 [Chrysoperla carnea]|uniref:uncharacterized protein LOC123301294 n=1 Tax=Chrysoperla carnea TaxID=189513 RepID=UPI001D072476|nr:uncharacterized protein LOC123301294 [Chrysoperla carnea]